jgi:hypothetical protein
MEHLFDDSNDGFSDIGRHGDCIHSQRHESMSAGTPLAKYPHYVQNPCCVSQVCVTLARIDGSHELVFDFHLGALNVELFA